MALAQMSLPQGKRVTLDQKIVLRLERTSGIREIRVLAGWIWLTETPANGDVILGVGERCLPEGHWPLVIEALGTAELLLVPDASPIRRTSWLYSWLNKPSFTANRY